MHPAGLYEVRLAWDRIERQWAELSVFCSHPTVEQKQKVLEQLTDYRQQVDTVIADLQQEIEDDEWLKC